MFGRRRGVLSLLSLILYIYSLAGPVQHQQQVQVSTYTLYSSTATHKSQIQVDAVLYTENVNDSLFFNHFFYFYIYLTYFIILRHPYRVQYVSVNYLQKKKLSA